MLKLAATVKVAATVESSVKIEATLEVVMAEITVNGFLRENITTMMKTVWLC